MTKCSGLWIDELMDSIGKYIALETGDGIVREGKLSGFRCRSFFMDGLEVFVPDEIELNGDENDRVPLVRVAKITIS